MSDPFNVYNWYWQVQDSSPGTQRYSTASNSFVPTSDATYIAWTGRGNTATVIDTMANLRIMFNNVNVTSYVEKSFTTSSAVDITLTNPPPSTSFINMTAASKKVILPRMDTPSGLPIGQRMDFTNTGATNAFTIYYQDGTTAIATVQPGRVVSLALADNTTANGTVQTVAGTVTGPIAQVVTKVFITTSTWNPTPGMKFCIVECVGPGGGAGAAAGNTDVVIGSAGGGAGAYARKNLTAAQAGASQPVTIQAAGVGSSSTNGTAGGNTYFGPTGTPLCYAQGGFGGPSTASSYAGGLAGSGGVGDFVAPGSAGMPGIRLGVVGGSPNPAQFCGAGNGGPSAFGGGGQGGYAGAGTAAAGSIGGYGGGGGGGHVNAAAASARGADGGGGMVIVTEYI